MSSMLSQMHTAENYYCQWWKHFLNSVLE